MSYTVNLKDTNDIDNKRYKYLPQYLLDSIFYLQHAYWRRVRCNVRDQEQIRTSNWLIIKKLHLLAIDFKCSLVDRQHICVQNGRLSVSKSNISCRFVLLHNCDSNPFGLWWPHLLTFLKLTSSRPLHMKIQVGNIPCIIRDSKCLGWVIVKPCR